MAKEVAETPLMKQYNSFKSKYPDAVLLFRVGDFYETFGEDAIKASQVLGIVLTQRKNGAAATIELAGFPHHSLDTYLPKLVKAGYRVAICDQLEDPKFAKGIVKRGVTELVTPGVSYNEKTIEQTSNHFLAAVTEVKQAWGVVFLDLSTGQLEIGQGDAAYIKKLMHAYQPKEVLHQKHKDVWFKENMGSGFHVFRMDDWAFNVDFGVNKLTSHFGVKNVKGFGIESLEAAIAACGAVFQYLEDTQHDKLGHIKSIRSLEEKHFVGLDAFTIRNLELITTGHQQGTALIDILDNTCNPMGARMMRRWMMMPLREVSAIQQRHAAVKEALENSEGLDLLREGLRKLGDMERIASRMATGRITPREAVQLGRALDILAALPMERLPIVGRVQRQQDLSALRHEIKLNLHEDAPHTIGKGPCIATGMDAELDELRGLMQHGKEKLEEIEQREMERTGISSLKVAYNQVFGYYLEVRNTHKDKVPTDWIRKQTLTQAERYITEELKTYETKILGAEEKIIAIEQRMFQALIERCMLYLEPMQYNSRIYAEWDVLGSFAFAAQRYRYTCPEVNESTRLEIEGGRHPVIEQLLPVGEPYIENDLMLDTEQQQIIMITGPNMSGKSALLRQTALLVLMAQMGSFVPAKRASIGVVDKIFTRVGASDNLSAGESTFMVEMNETASIMHQMTGRSLILLDEIGRGTSTYDGISIAWSIAAYLHDHGTHRPRTLFATHYHELNEMSDQFERIHNFNVSVKEGGGKILFLRKLVPGGSNHSFGIHVAQMAGMPKAITERAKHLLHELESRRVEGAAPLTAAGDPGLSQLTLFEIQDPVWQKVKQRVQQMNVNEMTPLEALNFIAELQGEAKKG
jgi:DNA mismatch repair protein MutS